jgi:hypothetical protein
VLCRLRASRPERDRHSRSNRAMHTVMERVPRPHPGAVRLRVALDTLASSLATVRLHTLLACERDLAGVLAEMEHGAADETWDPYATARELGAARAALTRCRRLGATLGDLARLSLVAQGRDTSYSRQARTGSSLHVHSLETRV